MRYIALISLIFICSCSSSNKFKSSTSVDSTAVTVHKEAAVSKKKDSTASKKSMITRNKRVNKTTKETAPVITWVKVDSAATVTGPDEHVTINVKGGKLIGFKGSKVKETKLDKIDTGMYISAIDTRVITSNDTTSKADSTATKVVKSETVKEKNSRSFNWWWLLLVAIAGGCYWLFFTKSGKQWKENAIGWIVSKFV